MYFSVSAGMPGNLTGNLVFLAIEYLRNSISCSLREFYSRDDWHTRAAKPSYGVLVGYVHEFYPKYLPSHLQRNNYPLSPSRPAYIDINRFTNY